MSMVLATGIKSYCYRGIECDAYCVCTVAVALFKLLSIYREHSMKKQNKQKQKKESEKN